MLMNINKMLKQGDVSTTRILHVGDIAYVSGGSTKVKILDLVETRYPLCEVLETREATQKCPRPRFHLGDQERISRQILWPNQDNLHQVHPKARKKSKESRRKESRKINSSK